MENETEKQVWVCLVKFRAYDNPTDEMEYRCYGFANGTKFMIKSHREAGCGLYSKVRTEL